MREIKFRAWDTKSKQMGIVINLEFVYEIENRNILNPTDEDLEKLQQPPGIEKSGWQAMCINTNGEMNVDNVFGILMQFTGLHDKNGTEMYEGDIIKTSVGYTFTVSFQDGQFGLHDQPDPHEDTFAEDMRNSEVIGNIYEHPELLTPNT